MTDSTVHTLGELAALLGLELQGRADIRVTGVATLAAAGPEQVSFYHNQRYFRDLATTQAAAVILRADAAGSCPVAKLIAENPYAAYAHLTSLFAWRDASAAGIHPSAVIHPAASISPSAVIGANVVIGPRASIGEACRIGANCVIEADCVLDAGCWLAPNVTLYHGVRLGQRVRVHAAVVLGSDGFGFAYDGRRHLKIEQLGGVCIGDDVEIGAGTTIDRGALDDTVIEAGVKIDNQVQIAHNVKVGANSIICGCSAIAGSSVIGKNCIIAGAVGVINHVQICDGVTVTAMSLVNQSITEPGVYSAGTGLDKAVNWKKNIVRFRQLDDIWRRLMRLEKR
ncbi:MAG: UDP-3-O-(3-hydroxymyristoyl)glucosamine N-acyltransferase [Pseudohongiellaceae bacterium]